MTSVAGIIAGASALLLLVWWLSKRPMRNCLCGRCFKSQTAMPRCRLSGPEATAWLEFRKGPISGRSVQLSAPSVRVGSTAANDVVLSDPAVSEQHFVIECSDRFVLKDLGATNGVYLNGVRTKECVLASEDRLTFGNCEAVVRLR